MSDAELSARLVDYQREVSPLVDRAQAFLRLRPYVMDPLSGVHYPPPMPSVSEWGEALYLLQTVVGSLRSAEGRLARWEAEGGPRA